MKAEWTAHGCEYVGSTLENRWSCDFHRAAHIFHKPFLKDWLGNNLQRCKIARLVMEVFTFICSLLGLSSLNYAFVVTDVSQNNFLMVADFSSVISVFYCSLYATFSGQDVLDWKKLQLLNILTIPLVIEVPFYPEIIQMFFLFLFFLPRIGKFMKNACIQLG